METTLPGRAYRSEEFFELERERIFFRDWVCVGREETIADAGSYLLVDLLGESLLVVRTREGDIGCFHNVCRHRGSRLVIDDPATSDAAGLPCAGGRFKGSIVCPYHSWTYGLAGELRNAPFLNESDGLRKEQLPLHSVDVETWGGFVFVNLSHDGSGEAPERTLPTQLGEIPEHLAHYPLSELRTGRRITYEVQSNWKCIVENFNECYHCGPVHPELCEIVPAFREAGGGELDWENGVPHREGATTFTFSGTTERAPFPDLDEEERVRHKGELVYPNLMVSVSPDHVAAFTLWPTHAGQTRIDCDFLFHPDEMAKTSFDPSDAVEFWDLVNSQDWRVCESVQAGMGSRVFSTGYYAPMEDWSMDIRRYLSDRLGSSAIG
ncbi:MAG TPA: aromatic ring-hydroxylating dioxygenase subunit alpha [Actinomycetota bacterium]